MLRSLFRTGALMAAVLILGVAAALAADAPPIVTGDIQAGIEQHIAEQDGQRRRVLHGGIRRQRPCG